MCRHCWQSIHFFLWSYKLPTPMSCKHQVFRRIFQIDDTFISCDIYTFVFVKFHDCKRENFSFRSCFSIIIWTVDISFVIMPIALTFYWLLHDWQYPLIGSHTSIDCITWFYWRHLAFGFALHLACLIIDSMKCIRVWLNFIYIYDMILMIIFS